MAGAQTPAPALPRSAPEAQGVSSAAILAFVEEAEQKLLRAGADRVVAPYAIGGSKIAQAVLRPTVLEFIELATTTEHLDLQIEQTQVAQGSALVGASLTQSRLRQDYGLIIVAVKKRHGAMIYTPPPETVIEAGDILIALGRRSQLDRLEKLAGPGDGSGRGEAVR